MPRGHFALRPNYEEWEAKPHWTWLQTSLLVMGIDPNLLDLDYLWSLHQTSKDEDWDGDWDKTELMAKNDEAIDFALTDYVGNFGFWLRLQRTMQSLRGDYAAGQFDHDLRVDWDSLPNDIVPQIVYDDPYIWLHNLYTKRLKQKNFSFRYTAASNVLYSYVLYSKLEIWSQREAINLLLGLSGDAKEKYPERLKYRDYDEHLETTIEHAITHSILTKSLTPINPNYEDIWGTEEEVTEYSFVAKDFLKWALDKGFTVHDQLLELMGLKQPNLTSSLPVFSTTYQSPYQAVMMQAIAALGISDDNQPKKEIIMDWIVKNASKDIRISQNKAEMLATFIRHPDTEKGGNRKKVGTVPPKISKGSTV